jgi:hypothetical protein
MWSAVTRHSFSTLRLVATMQGTSRPDSKAPTSRRTPRPVAVADGTYDLLSEVSGGSGSGARTSCPPEREARTVGEWRHDAVERATHAGGQDVRAPLALPVLTSLLVMSLVQYKTLTLPLFVDTTDTIIKNACLLQPQT